MHLNIIINFDNGLTALIYLAAAFVLFFLGKMMYSLLHREVKVNHELVEKDNFAFSIALTGYYIGLIFAIGSTLTGESEGWDVDLMNMGMYGGIAIVLLNLSVFINDLLLLNKFKVKKEILEDQNAGTGVVEAASSIATGLIIFGALSGDEGNIFGAIVLWAAAQVILVITSYVYNFITPYDIHEHIEKDNVAVGLGYAGALIALANIIRFAVDYYYDTWGEAFLNIAIDTGIGLLFLPLVRFLTDKILLPGRKITDELINQEKPNLGVGLIEAFAYIGGSVLITWCL